MFISKCSLTVVHKCCFVRPMWSALQQPQTNLQTTEDFTPKGTLPFIENNDFKWLTLSDSEKLKNAIFEIPIIPQTLNINN